MFNAIVDDLFLSQKIQLKKKYSKKGLMLYNYFIQKTSIIPKNVILIDDYIFFFLDPKDYYRGNAYSPHLKLNSSRNKVKVICLQDILIKQVFSFFPDVYIHDLNMQRDLLDDNMILTISVISYEERGVILGKSGNYIKVVNEIFNTRVKYDGKYQIITPIKIQCKLIHL